MQAHRLGQSQLALAPLPALLASLSLGLLVAGCSQSSKRPPAASSSTSAPATSASGATTTTSSSLPSAPVTPLELVKATPLSDGALLTFASALDPGSVGAASVQAFRDVDEDRGGVFEPLSVEVEASENLLRVRASVPLDAREVRIVLTDALTSAGGAAFAGSEQSAALSFDVPGAVYELRFRPKPLPPLNGSLARNVSDDHGGDGASATDFAGASLAGAIESAGDADWFRVQLDASEDYVFRTETSGDTVLTLYGADGRSVVALNDDDPTGGLHSRLAQSGLSGLHYVEVKAYGQNTPSYVLHVEGALARGGGGAPGAAEPGSDPASAQPLALGQRVSERLGPGDEDWYALDLGAGAQVAFEADSADVALILLDDAGLGAFDPVHVVSSGETLGTIGNQYGIDYQTLARLNGIANPNRISVGQRLHVPASGSPLTLTISNAGRYYLRAAGRAGARPAYELSARDVTPRPAPTPRPSDDHGDDIASASALSLGTPLAGAIEAAGDVDLFAVRLSAGTRYELRTASSGDTVLSLLDASGSELAKNDDDPNGGRASFLAYSATTSGTHYLRVSGYSDNTPSYQVSAAERAAGALPNPSRFRPRSRTDVWHIDFRLRADLFAQDMASHGMASGDSETDRLMRERVMEGLLSHLSEKYNLDEDGNAVRTVSWKVSFTSDKPSGTPGWSFSREAVGGTHEDGSGTLGVSYLDIGNRRKEDNDDLGKLGIFSASIFGRDSVLRPSLSAADKRYLDGSYLLGDGSRSEDQRFRRIREVADDWAHALAVVTAHEVGHSVGLEHDESSTRGIMRPALSRYLLSDEATSFASPSAKTLDDNLGKD